jgi:uncharacterized membrane protein YoaK (UPF0700 family)
VAEQRIAATPTSPFHDGDFPARASAKFATLGLSTAAGFVDAVGFIMLFDLFTAHMTGNTSKLGISIGTGDFSDAFTRLYPIPIFIAGVAIGAVAFEYSRRHQGRSVHLLLLSETALLVTAVGVGLLYQHGRTIEKNSIGFFVLVALLTTTMGLQTAVLRKVGAVPVHTTFITGMLTSVALHGVGYVYARSKRLRDLDEMQPHEHLRWIGVAGLVFLGYVVGASLGALGATEFTTDALLAPALFYLLAAIWVRRYRRPQPTS